jgi:predicted nucleotidyltransferase component of viral defense system
VISAAERRSRARDLGVQESAVERDFVLACLLAAHSVEPGPFVFRGGTALAKVYWADHRLSEDLDFITAASVPDLESRLERLAEKASVEAGISLRIAFTPARRGRSRSTVAWTDGEVILDVNQNEAPTLPAHLARLMLHYERFRDRELRTPTCVLPEILGNKWLILEERHEPRDLFDLWWGLCRDGVDFADLAAGHVARYRFTPVRRILTGAVKRIGPAWEERLAHQVRSLPAFDEVVADVLESYDAWEREGKRVSELSG